MKLIPLSRGYSAHVDDEDYDRLIEHKWSVAIHTSANHSRFYAYRTVNVDGKRTTRMMHREILGCPEGVDIDHEDTYGLNNQRHNLRQATYSQNGANKRRSPGTSQWKGVSRQKHRKWRACIKKDNIPIQIGMFREEYDAAQAYNFKALELFGEFARLNVAGEAP